MAAYWGGAIRERCVVELGVVHAFAFLMSVRPLPDYGFVSRVCLCV